MDQLKQKLQEEVNRYKEINKYALRLMEQAEPPVPGALPPEDLPPVPGGAGTPPAGAALPPAPGGEAGALPGGEAGVLPGEEAGAEEPPKEPSADDSTEEIDITDLVNMTKNIKQELENNKPDSSGINQKMDGVFSKLSELEAKLSEMDNIITKIDELGTKVEQMKPPTPVEKLEMRSLDSYPFNQKPDEFFAQKQEEMRQSGKNEYILTKDDVQNYNKESIKQSFNDRLTDDMEQNTNYR